jgi:hypothetical protein
MVDVRSQAWPDRIVTPRRALAAWAVLSVLTLLVTMTTLRISPVAWQDEVQILDYGRILLPGADRASGMSWANPDRLIFPINFPACVGSELAFRMAGRDMAGPRMLGLIGAMVASGALFGYLRARGIAAWIAAASAVAFLWDPMFAPSYRGARLDGWSMGAMLAACLVVRLDGPGTRWRLPLAGGLVAAGGLIWVSAIVLVPLVIVEILEDHRRRTGTIGPGAAIPLVVAGASGLVAMAVMLLPYWGSLGMMLEDTLGYTHERTRSSTSLLSSFLAVLSTTYSTPVLLVTSLLAMTWQRSWLLIGATAVALMIIMLTGPYVHRNIYLEPYLLIAFATGAEAAWNSAQAGLRRIALIAVVALCGWAALVTLGARNANAFLKREERDPGRAMAEVRERLGTGPYVTYLNAWRAYYAVRSMDWPFVRPFYDTPESAAGLLSRCDLAIIDPADRQHVATPEMLERLGFREIPGTSPDDLFRIYRRDSAGQTP